MSLFSSLIFKATALNLTENRQTIYTDFYLKDAEGYVLETDRGFYDIDGNSGTREPRVLETFGHSPDDFSFENVVSIELRYSSVDGCEISISLPIESGKYMLIIKEVLKWKN